MWLPVLVLSCNVGCAKTKERGGKLELHGSKIEVELESCADRIVYELSMQVLRIFLEEVAELLPGLIEREDSF